MRMPELLLLANLATTLYMTGLIWFVQVVHYPLFAKVGRDGFAAYEEAHTGLTTLVVGPVMLAEAATALLLLASRPRFAPSGAMWAGAALVALLWISTFFVQVPQHSVLSSGFDARAHSILVNSNWFRTTAWSVRAGLLLWVTWRGLATAAH